jgi:hypothetical protein
MSLNNVDVIKNAGKSYRQQEFQPSGKQSSSTRHAKKAQFEEEHRWHNKSTE